MAVDHDARRQRIAEATAAVIARDGLEAATIRRISAEIGGPTKIITYYFSDKRELLRFTWECLARQYFQEVSACGTTDIVDSLLAMAAADERSMLRWRVYAAFWDRATRDPVFAEIQRSHMEVALTHIGSVLRARDATRGDIERVSLMLNAAVQGISLQALVDPKRWPAQRIRRALADQVEMLLARPAAEA
ncbi:MAG TPA: TetR family transcriptional regulator C-terminal domain-containing protein [Steroidobacteraceae bacterium]|nr:TetR family transcriptional regulator C-terminal domain-containing protein [Steroidobacteraceae bacterium]